MKQLTFLDLCSGIGGFRLGLESAGHKCIGYCEYDKFARASYEAMYDTEGEWKADDVTKLKSADVPYADIWCFGFPCQDISVAGKQRGLVGKRSGIYFNIIDLIKCKEEDDKPTYLLVENVKNLLSINAGFDFATVLSEMDKAGYDCRWQVLNSKDFGVPQNRERVFIIANLRSRGRREILPLCGENAATLNQLIGGMQGYRVYGTDGISATLCGAAGGVGAKTGLYLMGNLNPSGHGQGGNVYHEAGLAPTVTVDKGCGTRIFIDQCNHAPKLTQTARCLTARYTSGIVNHSAMNSAVVEVHPMLTPDRLEKRQNGRRMKEDGEPMFTLTSQDRHGVFICEKVQQDDEVVLHVRNSTKQGFDEAHVGDGINLAYPSSKTRRGRVGKKCSQTLDCSGQMGTLMRCGRIRRLTPRECFRLQGFTDERFDLASKVNSDAQLYKQAGNAVTATVAFAVAMSLPESRE
ncbi:DNA (cytosine-5)-methyltransferase 1 [Kineothrix alysoides]|uniref:DNA (cytosine-5-)-methyltransferase n=1 Tax=Kineothrix alysoides TaxID=1469948 RepID=A0A4R1R4Z0_9FIRM|nr:DNA (cytosine-5-)-methyltransferase [Kineothrix alysoides]TCL60563.1 DNA (cytosine-5)-methyltransferase 1 [Kineothrix alysoides]